MIDAEAREMGTAFVIRIAAPPARAEAAHLAAERALEAVAEVEAIMSPWIPESPISQVNAAAGGAPVAVPGELLAIVRRALGYSALSGGGFDISFPPLADAWDFRRRPFAPPDQAAIDAAKALVDWRQIEVDEGASTLRLARRGMRISLGAIAKGYGVDVASDSLLAAGFPDHLVSGGGDVRARGHRPGGGPWLAGIQHPRAERGTLLGRLRLGDGALATSGDYEKFVIVQGQRYHHIIDPRTGAPARGLQSVSVLAPSAEAADAWATTLFVLGDPRPLEILDAAPEIQVLTVDEGGVIWGSPGFLERFEPLPPPPDRGM